MDDTQNQPSSSMGHSFIGKHFRMLADISTAAIFEYDLGAKEFSLLVNTSYHFDLTEQMLIDKINSSAYASLEELLQDFLHPDDVTTALEAHQMLYAKCSVHYMARIKTATGAYLWRNIYYTISKEQPSGKLVLCGYITESNDIKLCKGIFERFILSVDKCVLCLDVATDNYILFNPHDNQFSILAIGSNYSRSIVDFANAYVATDAREQCIAQMQVVRVAEALQTKHCYSLNINMRDPIVGTSYKTLKYSYYSKNSNLILVATDDQTRQLAEEFEYSKAIKEALSRATTDPRTGLYNRQSGEELIKKALEKNSGKLHALALLTLEHFERVSEGVGESFGKALLTDIVLRLKRLFRNNDILARVGDTRFLLFMADLPDEAAALRRVEDIQRVIRETCTDSETQKKMTSNIGLVFINGRPNLDSILRNAQQSLHTAVQAGENTFHIHQDKMPHAYAASATPASTQSDEDHTKLVLQLKERIFELLYSTPDFEQSIQMALALVGGMLDMSRVYVFENFNDNISTSNTFEWCNESVSSEIDNLQNLPFSSVNYAEQFDANGIFNCPDVNSVHGIKREILAMQGIRALLQVAIKDGNEIIGMVGFDECRKQRTFTNLEIDTLSFVAKIIGTFIRKKRMTDLVSTAEQDKVEALDNLPSYIYVLDQEHRLLYMNKMVSMLVPSALVGMKCHSALKGLDEPCPGCPAIRCENGRCSVEMYNPRYNLWVISSAARITWAGKKDMTLISCQDITSFKIMRGSVS